MIAFELHINGKKAATAGLEQGVMSVIANWIRLEKDGDAWKASVSMGGLDNKTLENLVWSRHDLKVGDEITLRLVNKVTVDQPISRERRDHSKELRAKKRYVRETAKKLGWKIVSK